MKNLFDIKKIEEKKSYFLSIINFLEKEIKNGKSIFPNKNNIFNCLKKDFSSIKLVIIGQDPYPNKNSTGFAFSTNNNKITKSLYNIFLELKRSLNYSFPKHGSLIRWIFQGIILLNSILTVEQDKPLSHKNIGWEIFTDEIIKIIDSNCNNIVYLLWGNYAKKKEKLLKNKNNIFFTSVHPCNKNFIGNNHFVLSNNFFLKKGLKIINWKLK